MVCLEHVVSLEILPVHGVLGSLDALGSIAVALDRSSRLADGMSVARAGDVANEGGHVHLVATADGVVNPEPVYLCKYSGGLIFAGKNICRMLHTRRTCTCCLGKQEDWGH